MTSACCDGMAPFAAAGTEFAAIGVGAGLAAIGEGTATGTAFGIATGAGDAAAPPFDFFPLLPDAAPLDSGISTPIPQCGQMPRLPAKKDFTFNLCPLGQRNLIPICYAEPPPKSTEKRRNSLYKAKLRCEVTRHWPIALFTSIDS